MWENLQQNIVSLGCTIFNCGGKSKCFNRVIALYRILSSLCWQNDFGYVFSKFSFLSILRYTYNYNHMTVYTYTKKVKLSSYFPDWGYLKLLFFLSGSLQKSHLSLSSFSCWSLPSLGTLFSICYLDILFWFFFSYVFPFSIPAVSCNSLLSLPVITFLEHGIY